MPSSTLDLVPGLGALPEAAAALLPGAAELYDSRAWYETVIDHALSPDAAPCFAACSVDGTPVAIVPLQHLQDGRALHSLSVPYTCLYRPLLAAAATPAQLRRAGECLGRFCRGWSTVRLDALPENVPALETFLAGTRDAGLLHRRFAHFGNWHEPLEGRGWTDYLAARPGTLRETIRRKLRRCEREAVFEVFAGTDGLERGIAAYEAVYARSWKEPEPFAAFNPALMRRLAPLGLLRLGILRAGETPIAAQFWVVASGQACVLKLAHDEAYKTLSPGTALTALMIRELLGRERIQELDFGRGDDPYKQLWTTRRRQRIGLLLLNPRRPAGLVTLGRELLGQVRRRVLARHPS